MMSSEVANEEGGVELTGHAHLAPVGGGQEGTGSRESPHLRSDTLLP